VPPVMWNNVAYATGSNITATSSITGAVLWTIMNVNYNVVQFSAKFVAYITQGATTVVAVSWLSTGAVAWQSSATGAVPTNIIDLSDHEVAWIGYNNNNQQDVQLQLYSLKDNMVKWTVSNFQVAVNYGAKSGSLYLVTDSSTTVYAVESKTGRVVYSIPFPGTIPNVSTVSAVLGLVGFDDRFLVASEFNGAGGYINVNISAVDGGTGQTMWVDNLPYTSPVVLKLTSSRNILVPNLAGIIEIDSLTGAVKWRTTSYPGVQPGSVQTVGHTLIFSYRQYVVAFWI